MNSGPTGSVRPCVGLMLSAVRFDQAPHMDKRHLAPALALFLASCSVLEPQASRTFGVSTSVTTDALFRCATQALATLGPTPLGWQADVTRRDVARGILETADFPSANRAGLRMRLAFDPASATARLTVKATGPYFKDLGAATEAEVLEGAILRCIGPGSGAGQVTRSGTAQAGGRAARLTPDSPPALPPHRRAGHGGTSGGTA